MPEKFQLVSPQMVNRILFVYCTGRDVQIISKLLQVLTLYVSFSFWFFERAAETKERKNRANRDCEQA